MRVNTAPSNCTVSPSASPEPYHLNDLGCPPTHSTDVVVEASPVEEPHGRRRRPSSAEEKGVGWLLGVATSIVAVLVPHLSLCHGMVATQVRRAYPSTSWTAVAGLYAAMFASWNVTGPATHLLLRTFSCRCVVLVGGVLIVTGLSLSFVAPTTATLYVSLGVMTGCGASLIENVNNKMTKRFFITRSDTISRACLVFRSTCQVLMPQCVFFLLDTYGVRGALLVLGGMTLHVFVSALIFPSESSSSPLLCRRCKSDNKDDELTAAAFHFRRQQQQQSVAGNALAKKKRRKKKKKKKRKKSLDDKDLSEDRRWKNPSQDQSVGVYQRGGHRMRTISLDSSRMLPDIPEEQEPNEDDDNNEEEEDEEEDEDDDEYTVGKDQDWQLLTSNDNVSTTERRRVRQESTTSTLSYTSSGEWESRRNSLSLSSSSIYSESTLSITSSIYSGSLSEVGSTLSIYVDQDPAMSGEGPKPSAEDDNELSWNPRDFAYLVKDPLLWLLTLSFTSTTLVSSSVLLYVPVLMVQMNLNPTRLVACLLSLHVITNIVGRVSVYWCWDKTGRPHLLLMITTFCILISVGGLIFVDDLPFLAVCVSAFGWSSGATSAIMPAVVLCTFGEGSHGAIVAFLNVAQGLVFAAGSPLLGLLLEGSGNLSTLFAVLMTMQGFAIIIWTFQSAAERCARASETSLKEPGV